MLWVGGLLAALVLLAGRYNWTDVNFQTLRNISAGRFDWAASPLRHVLRAYASSAYLLVILLPVVFLTARRLWTPRWPAWLLTVVTGLIFASPYRRLGLAEYQYGGGQRIFLDWYKPGLPPPRIDWLPGGFAGPRGMPHEFLFFGALAGAGVLLAVAWAIWPRRRPAGRNEPLGPRLAQGQTAGTAGPPPDLVHSAVGIVYSAPRHGRLRERLLRAAGLSTLVLLLLAQTWLHLSTRSPYTYVCHYVPADASKPADQVWYTSYLFPETAQGAVNQDYFLFRELEEYFIGVPQDIFASLIRRCFSHYVASQFTYFCNPYYVWLVLNVALWLAAALAFQDLVRRLWDAEVARYALLLMAGGAGFICFVAQPKLYLAGYASLVILLWLYERLTLRGDESLKTALVFGAALGLGGLTYDVLTLAPFLPLYAAARCRKWRPVLLALVSAAVAFAVYGGFMGLQTRVLHLAIHSGNAKYLDEGLQRILDLARHPSFSQSYLLALACSKVFLSNVLAVGLVLTTVLAGLGLAFRRPGDKAGLALLLGVPSALSIAFLTFGQTGLQTYPRLNYPVYPALYALAALFLAYVGDALRRRGHATWAVLMPVVLVLAVFVLNNLDVFGFPQLYYMFCYPNDAGTWAQR